MALKPYGGEHGSGPAPGDAGFNDWAQQAGFLDDGYTSRDLQGLSGRIGAIDDATGQVYVPIQPGQWDSYSDVANSAQVQSPWDPNVRYVPKDAWLSGVAESDKRSGSPWTNGPWQLAAALGAGAIFSGFAGGAGGVEAGALSAADKAGLAQMAADAGIAPGTAASDAFIASGGTAGSTAFGGGGVGTGLSTPYGPSGGASVPSAGAADALGLAQMAEAAGIPAAEWSAFIESGGTLGSTAAGGGGVGLGAVDAAVNFAPPSGPGVSTPVSQQVATTSGPALSGSPIGGDPNLPLSAQGTPGVPPSATQPAAPVTERGVSAGMADKLRLGTLSAPPGTSTAGKTILDRLGITKDGGVGPSVLPVAALAASALAKPKGGDVKQAAQVQEQKLTQLNEPARGASEELIRRGMSGEVPTHILSQFDQSMTDRIEQIKQRYASMGRDPDKDSAAAQEVAKAREARDQQVANYSNQLLQQGLSAAGLVHSTGGAAAGAGVNAAIAGAQNDQQFSQATAEMLKQMAMLQSMNAGRGTA